MDNASAPSSRTASVFPSHAREDAEAARRIAEALRSHGVEVWLDQSELRSGDAWDPRFEALLNDSKHNAPLF